MSTIQKTSPASGATKRKPKHKRKKKNGACKKRMLNDGLRSSEASGHLLHPRLHQNQNHHPPPRKTRRATRKKEKLGGVGSEDALPAKTTQTVISDSPEKMRNSQMRKRWNWFDFVRMMMCRSRIVRVISTFSRLRQSMHLWRRTPRQKRKQRIKNANTKISTRCDFPMLLGLVSLLARSHGTRLQGTRLRHQN